MRGKGWLMVTFTVRNRITPAHAGKSWDAIAYKVYGEDHPRACGEKVDKIARFRVVQGSPPRMRGKATKAKKTKKASRITPAHAGKSP